MDEAMPENVSSNDEPQHHSDSDNELLSLEDEDVIAQVGHFVPDESNDATSPADLEGSGGEEDNNNEQGDALLDGSDFGPASPDMETSDVEQASEQSDVDAVLDESSQGEDIYEGLAEDEQNTGNVQSVSSFDDALLSTANGDENPPQNLDDNGADVDPVLDEADSQDENVEKSPEQKTPQSPNSLEGPLSPAYESNDEAPGSPLVDSVSDVEDQPDRNESQNDFTDNRPSSPVEANDQETLAEVASSSDCEKDSAPVPASPGCEEPSPSDKEAVSAEITNEDCDSTSAQNENVESADRSSDSQEQPEVVDGKTLSKDDEEDHSDNLKHPLEADNETSYDQFEDGEMNSDNEISSPAHITSDTSTHLDNTTLQTGKSVTRDTHDSVDQISENSSLKTEDNLEKAENATVSQASVTYDIKKMSESNSSRTTPDISVSSKGGLHDDHGELDYYEDVDDVHMDGHKKSEGDLDQPGDDSKEEPEEGAILDQDEDEGEIFDGDEKSDEGEVDDEDCEEGEIKDPDGRKPFVPPVCRFYNRGHCTWGNNCRFLHPGVNDKGNYSLIDRPNQNMGPNHGGLHARLGPWGGHKEREVNNFENELPPPPEEPVVETAWERGLRHAKELMKKANKRKETDTNFEEKKMNLSLEEDRDQNKENDFKRYPKDPYYDSHMYDEEELSENTAYPLQSWHQGHFENFEVRWTRDGDQGSQPQLPGAYRERERDHIRMRDQREMMDPRDNHYRSPDRGERYGRKSNHRHHHNRHNDGPRERPRPRPHERPYERPTPPLKSSIRDERAEKAMMPTTRVRSDEWRDPWRRSKSPKIRRESFSRSRSRGRRRKRSYSRGSYSSSSSSSRSSRSRSSSYSSYSSRSSYSRSSSYSSRSRSRSPGAPGATKKPGPQNLAIGSINPKKLPPKPGDLQAALKEAANKKKPPQSAGDKGPTGPGRGIPKALANAERGRKLQREPPGTAGRGRRTGSGASSSGSSASRSSSSSRSRSASGSSRSSRSSSWSSSSSGSADSGHLYRDMANPGRDNAGKQPAGSPKKKPGKPGVTGPADKMVKDKARKEEPRRQPRTDKQRLREDHEREREKKLPPNKTPTKAGQKLPSRAPNVQGRPPPNVQGRPGNPVSRQPPMQAGPGPRAPPVGPVRAGPVSSAKPDSVKTQKMALEKQMSAESRPVVDSRQTKSAVTPSKTKDPLKISGQKPSIKLTLLNKPPAEKGNSVSQASAGSKKRAAPAVNTSPPPAKRQAKAPSPPPRPGPDKERKGVKLTLKSDKGPASASNINPKAKAEEKATKPAPSVAAKKAESPQKAASKPAAAAPVPKQKKSTSSRREELLKQLKAVEDAIARKRAKMN